MRITFRVVGLLAVLAMCAAAQPTINTNGIVNAVSFVRVGLPNSAIAEGSLFATFGTSFCPSGANFPAPPFGTNLNGVMVHVLPQGATTPVDAFIQGYAGGTLSQINAILPSTVPVGTATVTVEYNGAVSNGQVINVVRGSWGSVGTNSQGFGPAAVQNYVDASTVPLNTVNAPAHSGQTVTLWGTGVGPLPSGIAKTDGEIPGAPAVVDRTQEFGVQVIVGGQVVTPSYAGRSFGYPAGDQINFAVPPNVNGCYVPIQVKIGSVVSNTTTLAVAAEGSAQCSDDFTVLPTSAQGLRTGGIVLSRISSMGINLDSGSGNFEKISAGNITTMAGNGVTTYGACMVYTYKGTDTSFGDTIQTTPLDAGPQLTLTLPDNSTKIMDQSVASVGSYIIAFDITSLGQPWLVPGQYRIAVPGGSGANAVGAFNATLDVPQALVWTNANSLPNPIPRTADLPITWTGGGANDAVMITGASSLSDETGAGFICLARASDQHFTVPAYILSLLPATSGTGENANGSLAVMDILTGAKGTITPTPSGLDAATFTYMFMSAAVVSYL